jgi:dTDP-4-amino-4,6-dideoxygalactose transaminase
MNILENRFVNITAQDVLTAAAPLGTQEISGAAGVVEDFEKELSGLFGVRRSVTVNSGTVSIYCALRAIGLKEGDEVILPPTAVVMSALPVVLLGGRVVFADTPQDPGFGLDISSVERSISDRTRAVMTVPMWGYPTAMDELVSLCKDRGVHLLEDISQAHGTKWDDRYLGSFGDVGCMSTHERKLITTGEGGAVLTNNEEIAETVNTFRRYGLHPDGIGLHLGLNCKLPAHSAALGLSQARKLEEKVAARHATSRKLREGISDVSWVRELPYPQNGRPNYYGMVLQIDGSIDVKAFERHLEQRGVISDTWRYGYQPLYLYELFEHGRRDCPNAEALISSIATIPSHEGMGDGDVEQVLDAVRSYHA